VSSYQAVIFDVDGTLLDSNDAHARAWVDVLAEFGRTVDVSRVRPLIGKGGDKVLPELTGIDAESDEGKAISARRRTILLERYVPTLRPTRGARRLLESLRAHGCRLYVATSATRDELRQLLRAADTDGLFEEITSSDDAENSKPDPDIVSAALRRSKARPEQAIMIGDTPYDVEAALRAGIRIIGLRSGGWDDAGLKGAMAVYADPQDLLDNLDRSPLAPEPASTGHRSA
jgi:HAD superfamily hydrolase (TIGR01509 family)